MTRRAAPGALWLSRCNSSADFNAWRSERKLKYTIGVDGGVNFKTVAECARAGADVFVSGSALFAAHSLKQAVAKMRKIVQDNYPGLADLKF